jgi:hypothetical protein
MTETLTADPVDLDRFRTTPLIREPFDHLIVPGFIPASVVEAAVAVFPAPDLPGVLPAPGRPTRDAFSQLLERLRSQAVTDAFAAKFAVALDPAALLVTLRARTRLSDGQIHNDSETKIVTALIYLNPTWEADGGRLRLLHKPDDLEDVIAEVPPTTGTMLAFRRSDNSWHGHRPFEGTRRSIMLNWMVDAATMRREQRRHALSAGVKSLFSRR